MKFSFSCFSIHSFSLFLFAAILLIPQTYAQMVEISDSNLRQVIREALKLPDGTPITQQEVLRLGFLDAGGDRGITDLTGLQYATNLWGLDLYHNPIVDISPLAHLTKLEGFNLWGCRIVDLSPLRDLKNLRTIILGNNQISDITPLANLAQLTNLGLDNNQIRDISPLANLILLEELRLNANEITDVTPLVNLTALTDLILTHNQIGDLTPLVNLVNLERLYIRDNLVADFSPLNRLNLIEFEYDEVCDIELFLPSVRERIESRSFPSVFQAWDNIVGLDHLTWDQRIALHDLHWSPFFDLHWDTTLTEPTYGIATSLAGNLTEAREVRQRRLDQNPNMVFLVEVRIHGHFTEEEYPPGSDFWLRDTQNQILRDRDGQYLINFLKPEVQELLAKRMIAVERCGVFDGIMIDGFFLNGTGFVDRYLYPVTNEKIMSATEQILRTVRAQTRDDFLIIVNANNTKPTRYAEFINGTFLETGKDHPDGYNYEELQKLEDVLSWAEANLREPQITCLEGEGMSIESPDGPNNLRWMRLFTTLSLTHSDGYVIYTTGVRDFGPPHPHHDHLWHSFWDTDLGRPVDPKAQLYEDIPGVFIREFTNGWAVYNRSGNPQTITLPIPVIPASSLPRFLHLPPTPRSRRRNIPQSLPPLRPKQRWCCKCP